MTAIKVLGALLLLLIAAGAVGAWWACRNAERDPEERLWADMENPVAIPPGDDVGQTETGLP